MILGVTLEELEKTDVIPAFSFFSECQLPGSFKIEAFLHNWRMLLKNNMGAMWKLVNDGKMVGAMGGLLAPDMNDGEIVATEAFWYVMPEFRHSTGGLKMLVYFEKWAKEMGAKRIVMGHLLTNLPNALPEYYKRRGYSPTEIFYVKQV